MGFLENAWNSLTSVGSKASAFVSKGISSIFGGFGGGGGGIIEVDNHSKTPSSNSSSGSSGSGSGSGDSGSSDGSGDSSSDESSNDNTAENVKVNDPEKNKLLAEIRMSEELRETLNFTITIPKILKGLKTNQWFFMEISENFYEANYPMIMETIAYKKFGRYAGFKKGRFFVEKIVEKGGTDGTSTTITLNPIAPSYSQYIKMQMDAEKALVDALNDESKYTGTDVGGTRGGSITASGSDCSSSTLETETWAAHRCSPPRCTSSSIALRGNSSRQYAKDTAKYAYSSKALVEYVASQCQYQLYEDNKYGSSKCPEALWTGSRPIRANCADSARLLKCILDVNGFKSMICHIPYHYYNAIWENGQWTVCDICAKTCWGKSAYGHANHGDQKPTGTYNNPA